MISFVFNIDYHIKWWIVLSDVKFSSCTVHLRHDPPPPLPLIFDKSIG